MLTPQPWLSLVVFPGTPIPGTEAPCGGAGHLWVGTQRGSPRLCVCCWEGTTKLFWVSCRRGVAFLLCLRHQHLLLYCPQYSWPCWGSPTGSSSPPWQRGTCCSPGRKNSTFFAISLPCSLPSTTCCFGEWCFGPPFRTGIALLESYILGTDSIKSLPTCNSGEIQALKNRLNIGPGSLCAEIYWISLILQQKTHH